MARTAAPARGGYERTRTVRRLAAALGILAGLSLLASSPALAARPGGWGRPFRLAGPYQNDVAPARIAFSPTGAAAVAFSVFNEDFPQGSRALVSTRSPSGGIAGPRVVPHVQEILDLAYDGTALELLTGASPAQFPCCSSAGAVIFAGGRFTNQRTIVRGLDGAALGSLIPLPGGQLLEAIATGAGVWVAQSPAVGRYGAAHSLTAAGGSPQAFAASGLPQGRSAVGWTQPPASTPNSAATSILLASGNATSAPRSRRVAFSAPAGHGIDELALSGSSSTPTGAWTESWYDGAGNYHAEVVVADLGGRPHPRAFAVAGQTAAGLTMAADAKGDQVLAWKTCNASAVCSVRAASRAAARPFGSPRRLGAIDALAAPVAAVGPNGEALVGWTNGGRVLVADRHAPGGSFGPPATLSSGPSNFDLTLAFGPAGQALAAWTQGTGAPMLVGAFRR